MSGSLPATQNVPKTFEVVSRERAKDGIGPRVSRIVRVGLPPLEPIESRAQVHSVYLEVRGEEREQREAPDQKRLAQREPSSFVRLSP